MCIIGDTLVVDVGGTRLVVYRSIEDVPKIRTRGGSHEGKPAHVIREELAWSNQRRW